MVSADLELDEGALSWFQRFFPDVAPKISATMEELALQLQRHRGDRVVLMKGVYDLIHAGHLYSFAAGRQLGDRLVVCVETDESVRERKGTTRPVLSWPARAVMVAGLGTVHHVVPYSDLGYALAELQPDVFAASHFGSIGGKSGDRVGRTILAQVEKPPFLSTTDIVRRIRDGA